MNIYPDSEAIIVHFLSKVKNRRRFDASLRWMILCALMFLFLFGALLVVNRFFRFFKPPFSILTFCIIGIAASILIAVLIAVFRFSLYRPKLIEIAKGIDLRLRLKERLSSAVEIIEANEAKTATQLHNELSLLQLKDAASYATRLNLNLKAAYSYSFFKLFKLSPIMALPFLSLPFLPYESAQFRTDYLVRNVISQEGKSLIRTAENLKNSDSADIDLLAKEMLDLGKRLKSGKVSKREALKKISELSSNAQTKTSDLVSNSNSSANLTNLTNLTSDKLRQLAEKLEANQLTPEEKKKLELLLKDLTSKLGKSKPTGETLQSLQYLQSVPSQTLNSNSLIKIAESLKKLEKRQLEMNALNNLQSMLAQLQSSKENIGMAGITGITGIKFAQKGSKIESSPGDDSTNLQTIGMGGTGGKGKTENPNKSSKLQSMDGKDLKTYVPFKSGYAPTRLNLDKEGFKGSKASELELEAEENKSGRSSFIYSREKPDDANPSFLPYQKAYYQYKIAADDAISKERIPVQYRDMIRSYFEALNPDAK